MQIIEFNEEYKDKIINFLISIAIDEFGHHNWLDYLKNKDFTPYLLNDSKFLIVLEDKKIIATIGALKVDKNIIKINSFYIDKNYRGKKLGTKLYNLILDFSKQNNYKEIILCTYDEYSIAKIFYDKNGFKLYKIDGNEKWMKKDINYEN